MSQLPKRILHIVGGDLIYRGVEKFLMEYYKNIDRSKIQFDFLTPGICKNDDVKNQIQSLGGNLFELNVLSHSGKVRRALSFGKGILKILQDNTYDAVHANTGSIFMLSVISFYAWLGHAKVRIVHSHNTGKSTVKHIVVKAICSPFLIVFPTHYFACSQNAGEYAFPKLRRKKIQVIPNSIDTNLFAFDKEKRAEMRNALSLENNFVIGCVGAFTEQKNHKFLVDVFVEVNKIYANVKLLLIGDGILLADIQKMIAEKGLTKSVIFVKTTSHVNDFYQVMDCFVLPSIFEGLGIVVIEAQAAGLPTLCSDNVPPETKITQLIEYMPLSSNIHDWAKKIVSYTKYSERHNTSEEIKRAGFDIHQAAKHLEEIYSKIIP